MGSKSFREVSTIKLEFDESIHSKSEIDISKYKSIRRERTSAKLLNDRHQKKSTLLKIQRKFDFYENVCTKYFKHVHTNA